MIAQKDELRKILEHARDISQDRVDLRDRAGDYETWTCPWCFAQTIGRFCVHWEGYAGCKRRKLRNVPLGSEPELHIAFCGPSPTKTLSVLSLVWDVLGSGDLAWTGKPCWDLTTREVQHLRRMRHGAPTTILESLPKFSYTLARSALFSMHRRRTRKLVHFHNMATRWLDSEEVFAVQSVHLIYDDFLVLVLDLNDRNGFGPERRPHASIYSKVLRFLERDAHTSWKATFRGHVVVAVPSDVLGEDATPEVVEKLVRKKDPQLWGLLTNTVSGSVSYLGGSLTLQSVPPWIHRLSESLFR